MIKKTKHILFFSSLIIQFVFCNLHFAFAQVSSLSPSLIGSTGNFSSASFGSISSSVGEPMGTTISSGSNILTQGFQQPDSATALTFSVVASASPATICAGSSTTLTATISTSTANPPYTYSWLPATSCPSCSNTIATPTSTGITVYTVTVTDDNPTSITATVAITVSPKPLVSISSTYNLTTICTGDQIFNPLNATTLTASPAGASSYLWAPGGLTTASIKVGPTGVSGNITYTVEVTNVAGCMGRDTMHINVVPLHYNQPIVNPSTATYCANEPILPDTVMNPAGPPSNIFWSYQSNAFVPICTPCGNPYTPQITNSTSYFVVQGTLGCFSNWTSVSVTINPSPTVTVSPGITICPGFTAQLTSTASGDTTGLSHEWFINSWDSLIPNSNFASMSVNPPRDSTMYIVGVYNSYGCWDKDTVTVLFGSGSNCELHIFNGITPNDDGKNDEWWIDGIRAFPKNNVSIFNRWGDNVWTGKNYDNDKVIWKGTDGSGQKLPSGTYYSVIELFSDHGNRRISKWIELSR